MSVEMLTAVIVGVPMLILTIIGAINKYRDPWMKPGEFPHSPMGSGNWKRHRRNYAKTRR